MMATGEVNTYDDVKNVPEIKELDQLVEELHKVFESDRVNIEYVSALLRSYKSNPKDWRKFAKFDQHRYTRNLIDEGNGKSNMLALCWGEGHGSSIHDHTNASCFVKILDGQLKETRYDWPKEGESEDEGHMTPISVGVLGKDEVTYMEDSLGLHRMENPSNSDSAVSLHLYCPPFDNCQAFDERTGHHHKVMVTFWSKYGEWTPFQSLCGRKPEPENN